MEDDELEKIRLVYRSGEMLKFISELQTYVKGFQDHQSMVTEEVIDEFMKVCPLEWKANPNPKKPQLNMETPQPEEAVDGVPKMTKNQEKKLAEQKMIDEKKAAKEKAG